MKRERSLVGVIYIYIKGRSVCACVVHALAISVYQLLTNEQQISLTLKICGHFMDVIMAGVSPPLQGPRVV